MQFGRRALLGHASSLGVAAMLSNRLAYADDLLGFGLLSHGRSPQNLATPTSFFDRLITPNPVSFVRSHFGPPALDRTRKLTVTGMVKSPLSMNVDELRTTFREVTVTAVLQCAGNGRALHRPRVPGIQWVHGAMGQATFTGVRLSDILAKAGLDPDGAHVRLAGADAPPKPTVPAFVRSIPIARAIDPSTVIATKMNGEDLSLAHGAPMRLVVPGWAGDHWVKWLTDIRVQKEEADGFYMQTAYRMPTSSVEPGAMVPVEKMKPATRFPVKSLIGSPTDGGRAPVGVQRIVGIAFSGEAAIKHVEVSLDGGATWAKAKLEGEAGPGRWQVFRHEVEQRTPGPMRAIARATDAKGSTQPKDPPWNPSGYFWNGWHEVAWSVA